MIGMAAAYEQAMKSLKEGGIPIGSALLIKNAVVALGHNRRRQKCSNILHGETDCIENAGHHVDFTETVLFSTLYPCAGCAGYAALFKIPTIVVLDDVNTGDYLLGTATLHAAGTEVIVNRNAKLIKMMASFQSNPETRPLWLGDVGRK